MASLFLSYSRKDSVVIELLKTELETLGHRVWTDKSDLPDASVWRKEIATAIEQSDVFLAVVSASSLRSKECREEFEHARNLSKRVVPVVLGEIDPSSAPPDLADIHWIPFAGDEGIARIDAAIRMDLDHLRQHTRLLINARDGTILRGEALREAEQWLAAAATREPAPTELHRRLVALSLRAEKRRRVVAAIGAVLAVAIAIGLVIIEKRRRENQRRALANRLAGQSEHFWNTRNYDDAMLYAVAAYEAAPTSSALRALLRAQEQPQLSAMLHGHQQEIVTFAFDPTGGRLVSAGKDEDGIHVFDTRSLTEIAKFGADQNPKNRLQFSLDGRFLVSGDGGGEIRRWHTRTWKEAAPPFRSHRGMVFDLAIHPKERFMAVAYSGGPSAVLDLNALPPEEIDLPRHPAGRLSRVAFTRDGKALAARAGGGTALLVWTFADGVVSNQREKQFDRRFSALAASDSAIAVGLENGTIIWLNAEDLTETRRVTGHSGREIHDLAFDSAGTTLASAGEDGTVHVWRTGSDAPSIVFTASHALKAVAFEPGTSRLAVIGADRIVYVLDLAVRQPLIASTHRVRGPVQTVAFARNGASVVAKLRGLDQRVELDLASRRAATARTAPEGDNPPVTAIRPDGIRVTGYDDGRLVWHRGRETALLTGMSLGSVGHIVFSEHGDLVFVSDREGTVAAWKATSGNFLRGWKLPESPYAIAPSPDGRRIAIVDGTSRITLLDIDSDVRRNFTGQCAMAYAAVFRRDGRTLVTGCRDGTLELLDTDSRERLGVVSANHDVGYDLLQAMARHPREDLFVTGTEEGWLRLWRLDAFFWMQRACRRANRDLVQPVPEWSGRPLVPCSALIASGAGTP